MLRMSGVPEDGVHIRDAYHAEYEDTIIEEVDDFYRGESDKHAKERHVIDAWKTEAAGVDRSVRILPGVKRLMGSIPAGRYAVATSGAKTYGKVTSMMFSRVFVLRNLRPQRMVV
jgi:hypothetical protein